MKAGADPSIADADRNNIFQLAALAGDEKMLAYALRSLADRSVDFISDCLDNQNSVLSYPLEICLESANENMFRRLLDAGAYPFTEKNTADVLTPLVCLAASKPPVFTQMLVDAAYKTDPEEGIQTLVSQQTNERKRAIDLAPASGNREIVDIHVHYGAQLYADEPDHSLVHAAAATGDTRITLDLLKAAKRRIVSGAQLREIFSAPSQADGRSLFGYAASSGNKELLQKLVKEAASLNIDQGVFAATFPHIPLVAATVAAPSKQRDRHDRSSRHDKSDRHNKQDKQDRHGKQPESSVSKRMSTESLSEFYRILAQLIPGFSLTSCINAPDADGIPPFLRAISLNALSQAGWLLRKGADPSVPDAHGHNFLHKLDDDVEQAGLSRLLKTIEEEYGPHKIVELLSHGDRNGMTPLMAAVWDERAGVVDYLIKLGTPLSGMSIKNESVLHLALDAENPAITELVLAAISAVGDRHARLDLVCEVVDCQDKQDRTPFYREIQIGRNDYLPQLLALGASALRQCGPFDSALTLAVATGNVEAVSMIFAVQSQDQLSGMAQHATADGFTLAMLARLSPDPKMTAILKRHHVSADQSLTDEQYGQLLGRMIENVAEDIDEIADRRPAASAGIEKAIAPVRALLKEAAGDTGVAFSQNTLLQRMFASPGRACSGRTGEPPMLGALKSGHRQLIDLLFEYGAVLSGLEGNGTTPLHWAAQHDFVDILENYLDQETAGIEAAPERLARRRQLVSTPAMFDDEPVSALQLALENDCSAVIDCLIKNGADMAVPVSGNTKMNLLHYAAVLSDPVVLRAILDLSGGRTSESSATAEPASSLLKQGMSNGNTPLMRAVTQRKHHNATILANEDSDLLHQNKRGQTALSLAILNNDMAMIELLVNAAKARAQAGHGPDTLLQDLLDNADSENTTAFDFALERIRGGALATLVRLHGADNIVLPDDRDDQLLYLTAITQTFSSSQIYEHFHNLEYTPCDDKNGVSIPNPDAERVLRKVKSGQLMSALELAGQQKTLLDTPRNQWLLNETRTVIALNGNTLIEQMLKKLGLENNLEKLFHQALERNDAALLSAIMPAVKTDTIEKNLTGLFEKLVNFDLPSEGVILRGILHSAGTAVFRTCEMYENINYAGLLNNDLEFVRKLAVRDTTGGGLLAALVVASQTRAYDGIETMPRIRRLFTFDENDRATSESRERAINLLENADRSPFSRRERRSDMPKMLPLVFAISEEDGQPRFEVQEDLLMRMTPLNRELLGRLDARFRLDYDDSASNVTVKPLLQIEAAPA